MILFSFLDVTLITLKNILENFHSIISEHFNVLFLIFLQKLNY